MKAVRVRGFVDVPRSVERVVDLFVITLGHGLACRLAGAPWNDASQSVTAFAIVAFLLLSEIAGLYRPRPGSGLTDQGRLAPKVWAAALPLLVVFQVLSSTAWLSLGWGIWAVVAGAGMFAWRLGLRKLAFAASLRQTRSVAIVGATKSAQRLYGEINQRPWLRMRMVGLYDDRGSVRMSRAMASLRRGDFAELVEACKCRRVDTVIVALPGRAHARVKAVVEALGDTTATVFLLADLPSLDLLNATWTAVGGIPLVGLDDNPVGNLVASLRRALGATVGRVSPSLASRLVDGRAAAPLEPLLVPQPHVVDEYPTVFSPSVVGEAMATNASTSDAASAVRRSA